jgi:hypothetical protein
MSEYSGRGLVSADEQWVKIPVPQDGRDYYAITRITGTFVGTITVADDVSGDLGSVAIASSGATTGDATAAAVVASALTTAAKQVWARFSAYTSGEADLQITLIPQES